MPVTVYPASHSANIVSFDHRQPAENSRDLLKQACSKEEKQCHELIQSSFDTDLPSAVLPSTNGFVFAAIEAYSRHHHLEISPEDVWFAILSQLRLYINKNAEDMREKFVAHEGKKDLTVTFSSATRYSVDFAVFAHEMGLLIEQNVVDPDLRKWMMPAFTTTTEHDKVIASILMMGSMQKYFNFKCVIACGIPSVTLLGQKSDWQLIDQRLDKLLTFGTEPSRWHSLLKPVLSRFIGSLDNPALEENVSFWQKIAHYHSGGSGPSYYSGWITAFCFWDNKGDSKYRPPAGQCLMLDGVKYHPIESDEVPPGYSSVPVQVDDNGELFNATMIAGAVGINVSSSGDEGRDGIIGLDTVKSQSGWWIFETKSQKLMEEEVNRKVEEKKIEYRDRGCSESYIENLASFYREDWMRELGLSEQE